MSRTDAECVRLCLSGHPEMFRLLVTRYESPLLKYLAARLGNQDEAVEAAQETMVRAYFALPKLKRMEAFSSWLLGIADRVAKESRRKRRFPSADVNIEAIPDRTGAGPGPNHRPGPELLQAVADLPEPHQQVILMRFYGGQSCAAISRDLGVSLGTVTSRLSRAYALLREALRVLEPDAEVEP